MTRFEALGLLPDKNIRCFVLTAQDTYEDKPIKKLRQTGCLPPERFVDLLEHTNIASFRLVIRHKQPELKCLVKFVCVDGNGHAHNFYAKADMRKTKRAAKLYGLPLPKLPTD